MPRCGRPRVSVEAVAEVNLAINNAANNELGIASARGVARELNMPWSTVQKFRRKTLRMYPYKFSKLQKLEPGDPERRNNFALEFLARVQVEDDWLENILWSDEAHFTLSSGVNTKNCVIWASENPHACIGQPLHDKKVTVWCGFTADFILGPYFFENEETHEAVTVNGVRYKKMVADFVIPQLRVKNCLEVTTFMQDGATPHVCLPVRQLLREHFGNRIISRHFEMEWPPRSPDLNPLDFWLWGYLKSSFHVLPKNDR